MYLPEHRNALLAEGGEFLSSMSEGVEWEVPTDFLLLVVLRFQFDSPFDNKQ